MPEVVGTASGLDHAAEMLRAAAEARKCWACGCLRHALDTIEQGPAVTGLSTAVDAALAAARENLLPQRYECLGCDVCFPAVALNDLAAGGALDLTAIASCPTDAVEERHGWPPLPGAYRVLHYQAPIAVCTLNDDALATAIARAAPAGLAVVGTLHTEESGSSG